MKNIITALNKVMASAKYVQKDAENKFHGYKYVSEAALLETLRPALIDNGLVLIPSLHMAKEIDIHGNTTVFVEYTLAHVSGEIWPDKIMAGGCGNDRSKTGVGDKGLYKALTGANKYLLFKLFQIETGDDPERDTNAPAQDAAPQQDQPATKKKSAPEKGNDDGSPSKEDTENYVLTFIAALEAHHDEKEVREFWKSEAKNRSMFGIQPNSATYKKLAEASANYIEKVKNNGI